MLKIGHRGARAYEPENTIRSFRRALELSVDAIELDIRRTKDGELVVIHDDRVDRTTNGTGLVREITSDEIKKLVTRSGERIPTLEEALDFLDKKVKVLIELKEEGLEERMLSVIHEKGLGKNVIIISFSEEALKKIRKLDSDVETGLIYVRHGDPLEAARNIKANYLLPFYKFVHKTDVDKIHERGLKVIAWTINNREEVLRWAQKEVDGIASDKPDILTK